MFASMWYRYVEHFCSSEKMRIQNNILTSQELARHLNVFWKRSDQYEPAVIRKIIVLIFFICVFFVYE